jgi:hypothetical protein
MDPRMFDGMWNSMIAIIALSTVGFLAIVGGAGWAIYWIINHVAIIW